MAVTLAAGSEGRRSCPLPDGYYSLVCLSAGARVDGADIVGDSDKADITYNSVPPPAGMGDHIEFPLSLALDVVEISALILSGESSSAAGVAANSAQRVSQKREYAAIPAMRHFP
jgi:hypothetical protein